MLLSIPSQLYTERLNKNVKRINNTQKEMGLVYILAFIESSLVKYHCKEANTYYVNINAIFAKTTMSSYYYNDKQNM